MLLLRIVACLIAAPLLLRLPMQRLDQWMSRVDAAEGGDPARWARILSYTDGVCRWGRRLRLIRSYCISRGLTLLYLLRRAGLPVSLVFGIESAHQSGGGHCWLTLQGEPYAERVDPRQYFTAMYTVARARSGEAGAREPLANTSSEPSFGCRLHGLNLAFTGPRPIVDAIAARFSHLPAVLGDESHLRFEYVMSSEASLESCRRPEGRGRPFYDPAGGEATYWADGDRFFLELDARARALCLPHAGRCSVVLEEPASERTWIAAHPLVTLALMEMLKRRNLFPVHAASVAIDGRSLLLPGQSGSGKSTLSMALLRAGFHFMGDDLAFLEGRGARRVLAFPERISATRQTLQFFPEHGIDDESVEAGYPKHEISPTVFSGAPIAWEAVPGAVVFPTIAGTDRSVLTPMSSEEALSLLSSNLLLTEKESTQDHLDALAALANKVPAFRLDTGTNFEQTAEILRVLLR